MSPTTSKWIEIGLKTAAQILTPIGAALMDPTIPMRSAIVLGLIAGLNHASSALSTAPKDVHR